MDNSQVRIEHNSALIRAELTSKLETLGYTEHKSKNTVFHKAKSFMNCAVGRLTSEN